MPYAALLERTVAIPRERVYGRLAAFAGVAQLAPDEIASVTTEGEGIGCIRTVRAHGLEGVLKERLEALVEGRLLSYSMINDVAMPIDRYHAVVQLEDAPGGGCLIRWGSNWIARGASNAEVSDMLTALYGRLIDGIVRLG